MERMMVEIPIPPKWKQLWNTWNLRGVIILSLSLQTFLIFFAPLRKRSKSNWIVMPLWSAYLLADWTANFGIGLIWFSQGNPSESSFGKKHRTPVENEDLLAFWAPFLLVHLGGPDTITAFALEDNELWLRHFLGLVFQCLATFYVFFQSLPHNRLWVPTMMVFFTGIIKYAERTRALYFASSDGFKDSIATVADLNYVKQMNAYGSAKEDLIPTRIELIPAPDISARSANRAKKGRLTELEVIQYGYMFYEKFRGLVVDTIFSGRQRNKSRDFFLNRTPIDAFKVVEVELNFLYDVLLTKLPVVYTNFGAISRMISLTAICSAIVLFMSKSKTNFKQVDVMITYGLLFGALFLDMSALIMLLFSDWTIISLQKSPDAELDYDKSPKAKLVYILTERTLQITKRDINWKTIHARKSRRWSESISTYNLIYYCLHPCPVIWEKVFDKLGLSWFLDDMLYVQNVKFDDHLKEFIFYELKSKSELADDLESVKKISSAPGDSVLSVEEGWGSLLKYFKHNVDVDYDQTLILWHMATEICYNSDINAHNNKRKVSKLLSDYMLYLLLMQPSMMSAVAGIGEIRFRDTCADAKRFFHGKNGVEFNNRTACRELLKVKIVAEPETIKGNQSKSLLFDSCKLAKELMEIEKKYPKLDKWVIISKLWVELLCYAASHSRGNMQAAQLSKGGELITIVWLLMTHFGLGNQFQINETQAIAKLIVGK